jgi:hypothetical protein
MSVDPAKDFSDQIAQDWPQDTRNRRDGDYGAGWIRGFLSERTRLVLAAEPTHKRRAAASLSGRAQIEARPLPGALGIVIAHWLRISLPPALLLITPRLPIPYFTLIRLGVAVRESIIVYVPFHCAWLLPSATLKAQHLWNSYA